MYFCFSAICAELYWSRYTWKYSNVKCRNAPIVGLCLEVSGPRDSLALWFLCPNSYLVGNYVTSKWVWVLAIMLGGVNYQ